MELGTDIEGIKVRFVDVDPDLARLWLESNTGNRRLRRKHINFLAKEMSGPDWKTTHEGIAFSASGRLLDGQHRLHAVIESGKTIRFFVTSGWPDDNFEVLDQGQARRPNDRVHLFGEGIADHANSRAVRCLSLILQYRDGNKARRTTSQLKKVWEEVRSVYLMSVHQVQRVRAPFLTAVMEAAYVAAFTSFDNGPALLPRFVKSLREDKPTNPLPQAVRLRQMIILREKSEELGRYSPSELYRMTFRAAANACTGEP